MKYTHTAASVKSVRTCTNKYIDYKYTAHPS